MIPLIVYFLNKKYTWGWLWQSDRIAVATTIGGKGINGNKIPIIFLSEKLYNISDERGDGMTRPKYNIEIADLIEKMHPGSVFTASDFFNIADTDPINKTLSRLSETGNIRRIMQGVYDKPEYSELLKEYAVPRIDLVADALARKYNWTIVPCGDTVLNMFHLTTQVPNVWTYISDGPYRDYEIGNVGLSFKHCSNKEISGKSYETILLIQAIKAIGKESVSQQDIVKLRQQIRGDKDEILKESLTTTAWIRRCIKEICQEEGDVQYC